MENTKYLTPREAAAILRVSYLTLLLWRKQGKGPDYAKIGKKILYSQKAIAKFFDSNQNTRQIISR